MCEHAHGTLTEGSEIGSSQIPEKVGVPSPEKAATAIRLSLALHLGRFANREMGEYLPAATRGCSTDADVAADRSSPISWFENRP